MTTLRASRPAALVCLSVVLMVGFAGCQPAAQTVRVTRVLDGDTVVIETGERVRYIGIDAPEMGPPAEPFAREALIANRALVEGKRVRLEKDASDTDRYGRLLRYVYVDGTLVNAELVRLGLAHSRAYPPDTRHQEYLDAIESAARAAGLGIWSGQQASP